MIRTLLLVGFLFFTADVHVGRAQPWEGEGNLSGEVEDVDDDTLSVEDGWRSSLVTQLNATQSAFSNWQEGGINALALAISADGTFDRNLGQVRLFNEVRAGLGFLKQDTLSQRKSEDQVRYGVTAELDVGKDWSPMAALTARTQILPGYVEDPDASRYPTLPVVDGQRLKVSDFGAPAYLTQSVGVAYQPVERFRARAGVGVKETVVGIERLQPVFGNAPGQTVRVEAGLDAEASLKQPVMENVLWTSRLSAFQAFTAIAGAAPDVVFENTVALKVNNVLNVNVNVQTLYDRDVSTDLQLKEVFALGLSFTII